LTSNNPDSASEVDWESYLCEDKMLPASNWEEDFLNYKVGMMDHPGYKGIFEDYEQQRSGESGDKPWYPHDPNHSSNAEMEEAPGPSLLEDQTKICYGMVSSFFPHFILRLYIKGT
jgi:hypothetical protein